PQTRAGTAPAPPARSAATPPLAAPRATPAAPPKPSTPQTVEVAEGMDVASSDGEVLGVVKEVRANDFLLDRSGQRDLYVPLGAVAKATGNQIMLNVTASGVDDMGWPNPSLF
ncbi:MAG: DUF2171 domain-containing protein, partial [Chloroflexota bacterium]|nr:DUF2171 domain-containing protein [Chloroflexota bacterium]